LTIFEKGERDLGNLLHHPNVQEKTARWLIKGGEKKAFVKKGGLLDFQEREDSLVVAWLMKKRERRPGEGKGVVFYL